jgi:hypothetical protein
VHRGGRRRRGRSGDGRGHRAAGDRPQGARAAEVCAEWAGRAAEIDPLIAGPKGYRYNLLVQDAWNHEQDVLGALGLPQAREDATTRGRDGVHGRVRALVAQVRVQPGGAHRDLERRLDDRRRRAGRDAGDERLRPRQDADRPPDSDEMAAMGWTGDPSAVLDRLHFFTPPVSSLGE